MTNTVLKAQIDSQITNETTENGITPTEVGGNLKAIVDYVDQQVPYKSYIAYLSYNSGNSFIPTPIVVFNNLGIIPVWSEQSGMIFKATATDVFTLNKTVMFTDTAPKGQSGFINAQKNNTNDSIDFWIIDSLGDPVSVPFNDVLVEIRVYN